MSEHRVLTEQMIRMDAVQTIFELATQAKDDEIARDCVICLVNLTRMNGVEARLVEDGIVLSLMSLMNTHDDLATTCAKVWPGARGLSRWMNGRPSSACRVSST
jgi:hypothetical protein